MEREKEGQSERIEGGIYIERGIEVNGKSGRERERGRDGKREGWG
jgi:hypothetical protein